LTKCPLLGQSEEPYSLHALSQPIYTLGRRFSRQNVSLSNPGPFLNQLKTNKQLVRDFWFLACS